jgi:3-oxoacyl-[acyl-carrier protein] reductase
MPANPGLSLSISGKVALITGGSRGVGAAAVRLFANAGAKVFFNYQRARIQAENLVQEIGKEKCAFLQCDLSGTEAARTLINGAVQKFGRLDILVANHGVWPSEDMPVDRIPDEQWRNTLAVNLDSVFSLIKHAVGQMKLQRETDAASGGHIVLVSSTAGQRGEAFHCDYAASKGALISMVKGLSTELASNGIYVNCVAPGWVNTDMSSGALSDAKTSERILATIPLGRVATPEEIAAPILFLCTAHAGFITGEVLNVNGGAVLAG